jgi:hypothetical protein
MLEARALSHMILTHPSPVVQEYITKPLQRRQIALYWLKEGWGRSAYGKLSLNPSLASQPLAFQYRVLRHEAEHFRQAATGRIPHHMWAGTPPRTKRERKLYLELEAEATRLEEDF